jgi:hypothetical protein
MKTNRIQKAQEATAASPSYGEATVGESQDQDLRAYAPAGAAMVPIASPATTKPQIMEIAEPLPEGGPYFDEEDMDMNKDVHGDFSNDSETGYEEGVQMNEAEKEDFEDEYAEAADQEQDEASDSGEGQEGGEVAVPVKEIVQNINHIAFRVVEHGKLEIGNYVLSVVFNDEIDDVLSKNPNKKESLRAICDDPELRVDRRRLGNWVRAAALKRDLEANGVDCSSMMTTQLVALLGVKDQSKRRELAAEVNSEKLPVRKIREKAQLLNHNGNSKNAAKVLRRKIGNPLSLLADEEAIALLKDEHRLAEEIPYKDRTEIITAIDLVAKRIEQSKTFLEEVRDNLFLIDMERIQRRTS